MEIAAQELSASAFSAFGDIVERPSRNPDAGSDGWSWWAETQLLPVDSRPYTIGYLQLVPGHLDFDWAERHLKTVEMIVPLGGDCLVHVAPPDPSNEPDREPSLDDYRVFRIRQGQAVILRPGVWHAAPFTVNENTSALVFLLENTGRDDTRVVRFPDTPITIRP